MSSPVVAGIGGFIPPEKSDSPLGWSKNAIINCADEDAFTGNNLPTIAGDMERSMLMLLWKGCTVGIDDLDATSGITFQNYPNPFESNTTIAYDMNILQHVQYAEIVIADVVGSVLQRIQIKDKVNAINLSKGKLAAGMYNCSLIIDGKTVRTNKFLVILWCKFPFI